MPAKDANRPFPIVLEVEFLDRLSEPVREKRAPSVSDIIRRALEGFDFSNIVVVRPSQLSISVRLPAQMRKALKKIAREKHTSIGQLVRTAVESYLPKLENAAIADLDMPIPHVELPAGDTAPVQPAPASHPPPSAASPAPDSSAKATRPKPKRKKKSGAEPRAKTPRSAKPATKPFLRKTKTTAAGLKRSRPRRS